MSLHHPNSRRHDSRLEIPSNTIETNRWTPYLPPRRPLSLPHRPRSYGLRHQYANRTYHIIPTQAPQGPTLPCQIRRSEQPAVPSSHSNPISANAKGDALTTRPRRHRDTTSPLGASSVSAKVRLLLWVDYRAGMSMTYLLQMLRKEGMQDYRRARRVGSCMSRVRVK